MGVQCPIWYYSLEPLHVIVQLLGFEEIHPSLVPKSSTIILHVDVRLFVFGKTCDRKHVTVYIYIKAQWITIPDIASTIHKLQEDMGLMTLLKPSWAGACSLIL